LAIIVTPVESGGSDDDHRGRRPPLFFSPLAGRREEGSEPVGISAPS